MNADIAAVLRGPFAPEHVGKLPRVTCRECRDSRTRNCQNHRKLKCPECGNYITTAHLHLDYVGHAEATDRLLRADPSWTWEPVAFGPDGLPMLDRHGGLWIRLTVAGVTRIGYGHADGKTGPDAVKEAIGDALRNAAMRFGVALDLWGAAFKDEVERQDHDEQPAPAASPEPAQPATAAQPEPARPVEQVDQSQHKTMHALWRELGFGGTEHRETRLTVTAKILGLPSLDSSAALTRDQAQTVIAALRQRKAEMAEAA